MTTPLHQRCEQIARAHLSARPTRDNPAWMNCHHDCGVLLDYIEQLKADFNRLRKSCSAADYAITQALGRALGYPRYCDDQKIFPGATDADGVCVGENVAESMADEAATKIVELQRQNAAYNSARDVWEIETNRLKDRIRRLEGAVT